MSRSGEYWRPADEPYVWVQTLRDGKVIEKAGDTTARLMERVENESADIPARDLPGAIRNVATAAAISTDKALLLRGRPTQIVERGDAMTLLRKLSASGLASDTSHDAKATAEDDPPVALPAAGE